MTTTLKGTQIVSNFKKDLTKLFDLSVKSTSISRQVFEIDRPLKCLLYVKARSANPIRWGVTANVIARLMNQEKPWALVLLFLTHESGYFLTSADVNYYIEHVWPLGSDGDYKTSEGAYLSQNFPFISIASLIERISKI